MSGALVQAEVLPEHVKKIQLDEKIQSAVYKLKTNSSTGTAFVIGNNLVATTFHNVADVSDIDEITLSREGSSDVQIQKVVAASFLKDIAILQTKQKLGISLEKSSAVFKSPFLLIGYDQGQLQQIKIKDLPFPLIELSNTNHYQALFESFKDIIHLNGAPVINNKGKFVGMVYHSTKNHAHFISAKSLTSLASKKSTCETALGCIEKERKRLKNHMEHYIRNPRAHYQNKIFHLRNVLKYAKKHLGTLITFYLKKGAYKGSTEAQFHFGFLSLDIGWIEQAAMQGHKEAPFLLGKFYTQGAYSEDSKDWSILNYLERNHQKAANWMRQAAEQGHPEAQFRLGDFYAEGTVVPKDLGKSFEWILRSAKQKYPEAQFRTGMSYLEGIVVEKSLLAFTKWLEEATTQGHKEAPFVLGKFYAQGAYSEDSKDWSILNYARRDHKKAVHWIRQAAEQGHKEASFLLGKFYTQGAYSKDSNAWSILNYARRDYEQATHWMRQAAEQGHPEAQFELGDFYAEGTVVPRDLKKSFEWILRSAKQKYPEAQFRTGMSYLEGIVVEKSLLAFTKWLEEAAEQGHKEAPFVLGKFYAQGAYSEDSKDWSILNYTRRDHEKTVHWMRQAAEQGHKEASFVLGKFYTQGAYSSKDWSILNYARRDHKKAVHWMRQAAEQGHPEAQFELGDFYAEGTVVPRDLKKSFEWILRSAKQKYPEAQFRTGMSYLEGIVVEKNLLTFTKWLKKAAEQGHPEAQVLTEKSYVEQDPKIATNWFEKETEQRGRPAFAQRAVQEVKPAIYRVETPSSKGTAFFIQPNLAVTTFETVEDVSYAGDITLFYEGTSMKVREIVAVSFYGNVAFLKTEKESKHIIKKGEILNRGYLYSIGYNQREMYQITSINRPVKLDEVLSAYRIIFNYSKNFQAVGGSPILNARGEYIGMSYDSASSIIYFTSADHLSRVFSGKLGTLCNQDIRCIQKERELLKNHMKNYIKNPQAQYPNSSFHLRRILKRLVGQSESSRKLVFSYLKKGSEYGYTEAQFTLGVFSLHGIGIPQNFQLAKDLFKKAANKKHLEAEFELGVLYAQEEQEREAFEMMWRASLKGLPEAQFNLGKFILNSIGVVKPLPDHAFYRFEQAAKQGHPHAQFMTGLLHLQGPGRVEKDDKQALYWLRKAAEQGHKEAQFMIGTIFNDEKRVQTTVDFKEVKRWLKKAAEQGHPEAQFRLGLLLHTGSKRFSPDPKKSMEWFRRAAEQDHKQAQLIIQSQGGKPNSCDGIMRSLSQ